MRFNLKFVILTLLPWLLLGAALGMAEPTTTKPGMAKTPPATVDDQNIAAPTPSDAIDPNMVKPAPPTEPRNAPEPADGAIASGTCMKGGKALGAVTQPECRSAGGQWKPLKVRAP